MPIHGILLSNLGWCPSCYFELLDKKQKQICRTVGPSLAASLELLAQLPKCGQLSLFYRYYFGRCSSELPQLIPLPFSRGRSIHCSDRLHDFSVIIFRCYKDAYVKFLSSYSLTLEFSAYRMLFFDP